MCADAEWAGESQGERARALLAKPETPPLSGRKVWMDYPYLLSEAGFLYPRIIAGIVVYREVIPTHACWEKPKQGGTTGIPSRP